MVVLFELFHVIRLWSLWALHNFEACLASQPALVRRICACNSTTWQTTQCKMHDPRPGVEERRAQGNGGRRLAQTLMRAMWKHHKDISAKALSALNQIEFSAIAYLKPWPSRLIIVPYIVSTIVEIAAISKVNLCA